MAHGEPDHIFDKFWRNLGHIFEILKSQHRIAGFIARGVQIRTQRQT